jgi:hypothetical protein
MFCPQCATESSSDLQYCRSCGANLKVIGKAVTLSEAIARSDRGPLPKIKEMMKNFKVDRVSEEISHALEQMNKEIVRSEVRKRVTNQVKGSLAGRRQKTPAERRENLLVKGTISIFSGAGFALFLYFLTHAINLQLPADVVAQIPFAVDPVVRVLWLVGLIPALAGVGRILAALSINTRRQDVRTEQLAEPVAPATLKADTTRDLHAPPSVTERTTNLLRKW